MIPPRSTLVLAALLLGACNMVMSEKPLFADADRSTLAPRAGLWLMRDKQCRFDESRPESGWPQCAMWVVVRSSGDRLEVMDGKGQTEQLGALFAAGDPPIIEVRWVDTAKDSRVYYGYLGLTAGPANSDGRFSSASAWLVECGEQDPETKDIQPHPGIGPDCRPSSKDAVRLAAKLSHRADTVSEWRWLRDEAAN